LAGLPAVGRRDIGFPGQADAETADIARRILRNERETADKIAASWDHAAELSLQSAGVSR